MLIVVALIAAALLVIGGSCTARRLVAGRLSAAAAERGLDARWGSLTVRFPARIEIRDLLLVRRVDGDTALVADSLSAVLDPWSLLGRSPRPERLGIRGARVRLRSAAPAEADSLELAPAAADATRPARAAAAAEALARAVLVPARRLPELAVRDLVIELPGAEADAVRGLALERLTMRKPGGAVVVDGAGALRLGRDVPFDLALTWQGDDRITGRARFEIPDPERSTFAALDLALDGRATQDVGEGRATIGPDTRLEIGPLQTRIGGSIARNGPAFAFTFETDGVTKALLEEALPRSVMGPLHDVAVRGSFDYRVAFDLDFARLDDVRFDADVIPHGLVLDPAGTRLRLFGLTEPFTAVVQLPRDRRAVRELSPANPHFVPIAAMDSNLVHAVVTNEDGGFYRHRGFNTGAVREAIAENLRAGAFRRGAGTITMQLARNLYLGHERTLSRKFQEVVLAWVLEHLTGMPKERLLEVYLNVIEWGPDVHGADEAAAYYFGKSARALTVDECLFLVTLIPSPAKWKWRVDKTGALRPSTRSQMHFIGRAMIAKGWLDPARLPPADSLEVRLSGLAGAVFDTLVVPTPLP